MPVQWKNLAALTAAAGAATYFGLRHLIRTQRHFSYAGRNVVITGGARGLGLVLARKLFDQGARVAICSRTQGDLDDAARELEARGGEVIAEQCDVRDRTAVEHFFGRVEEQWGGVDVLLNVAGVIQVGPLDTMTLSDFHDAMDTHCWGVLHTCLAVIPGMRERRWGRIVNVSSLGGKRSVPHMLPYAASKAALVGLSNGLRAELMKDGIFVTTICPSLMNTGSPRNAIFKGQHRKEYAWFSIGDALPIVSMSAEHAADKILAACQHGTGEVVLGGNVGVLLQSLAPQWTQEMLCVVDRLLPAPGGIGRRQARGYQSQSSLSPSWLTQRGERAAARNNEM